MADVTVTTDNGVVVDCECENCGNLLESKLAKAKSGTWFVLSVKPCQECMEEARQMGREEGREEERNRQ